MLIDDANGCGAAVCSDGGEGVCGDEDGGDGLGGRDRDCDIGDDAGELVPRGGDGGVADGDGVGTGGEFGPVGDTRDDAEGSAAMDVAAVDVAARDAAAVDAAARDAAPAAEALLVPASGLIAAPDELAPAVPSGFARAPDPAAGAVHPVSSAAPSNPAATGPVIIRIAHNRTGRLVGRVTGICVAGASAPGCRVTGRCAAGAGIAGRMACSATAKTRRVMLTTVAEHRWRCQAR